MKLLLSSDAAPAASTADLTRACRRRSLAGLELTAGAGHGHGINRALCPPREQADVACVAEDCAPVHWLRVPPGASKAMTLTWAGGAHRLGAGLLLPAPMAHPPMGVPLALAHGTDPEEARKAACWAARHGAAQTCWTVAPGDDPGALEAVLDATGERLAHVRLLGAGPEAQADDGRTGAHSLWSALALRGYAGTVALAPSSEADLETWSRWLFDARGWGCNTAAEKKAQRDACPASSTPHPEPTPS